MTSNLSHLKKYRERPSPPFAAQAHKGKIMKGNDRQQYKSTATKNGIYRWIRWSSNGKTKQRENRKTIKESSAIEKLRVSEIKFPVRLNMNKKRSTVPALLGVRYGLEAMLNRIPGVEVTGGGIETSKNGRMDVTVELRKNASLPRMKTAVRRFAMKNNLKQVKISSLAF